MSYRIIFKGTVPEEFVDDNKGLRLAEAWEEGKLNGKVRINENIYEASSIKAILSGFSNPDKTDSNEKNRIEMQKIKNEHEAYIALLLSQPPEIRAKNTGVAELLYTAVTGKEMSEEVRDSVIKAQEEFFLQNPNYSNANPTCYKHLFKGVVTDPSLKGGGEHISKSAINSVFNFVERVVANGIV